MKPIAMLLTALLAIVAYIGVHAQSDVTAPVVVNVTIEPTFVDTSSAPQTVTVTAHITDDLSGLGTVDIWFGPKLIGGNQGGYVGFGASNLITGTPTDGIYISSLKVPRYSAYGRWTAKYYVGYDAIGNQSGCRVNGQMDCPPAWDSFYFINARDDSWMYLPNIYACGWPFYCR